MQWMMVVMGRVEVGREEGPGIRIVKGGDEMLGSRNCASSS